MNTLRRRSPIPPLVGHVGACALPALVITVLLALATGGTVVLLAGAWVLWRAQRLSPPVGPWGCIVVPGKRLRRGKADADYWGRLRAAAQLWRRSPVTVWLSGADCDGSGISEAAAGREVLLQEGVDPAAIALEQQARTSYENLRLLKRQLPDRVPAALVARRLHLPRLLLMARALDLELLAAPVEPRMTLGPRSLPRWLAEGFYVLWFVVADACRRSAGGRD